MKALKENYSKGWRALVKVDKYNYNADIMGPPLSLINMAYIMRTDFTLRNADK
jgi:hypothetical protein